MGLAVDDEIFNGGCRVGAIWVPGVTQLTRVSKIETYGERIGGRAVLGQNFNICALYAKSVFIASGAKYLLTDEPAEPSHTGRRRRLRPPH